MHSHKTILTVALLALSLSQTAVADLLVDTGIPSLSGGSLLLNTAADFDGNIIGGQWLAAEFTTITDLNITDLNAYITGGNAGDTFIVSLYHADFSPIASYNASFASDGWNGVNGISASLAAGSYWVGFEVSASQNLSANVLTGVANPALAYAVQDPSTSFGYQLTSGVSNQFAVQINASAVPVPTSVILFGSGLLGLLGLRKRQAV